MRIRYSFLSPDRWDELKSVFEQFGGALPHPSQARIAVAVDTEGKIQGMLVLQLIAHMEPIWISEEAKGDVRFTRLVELHETQIPVGQAYFAFLPEPGEKGTDEDKDRARLIGGMEAAVGMEPMPWKVMRKVVK